jgi:hydroxymethylpyrimidine pyrophosphatase-like HAD family hydrolase
VEAVVIFFRDDKEIEPCRRRLEKISGITVTSSIAHNLELCSDKAGKGEALKLLSLHLGLKKYEIIAVGDNMNDTSMFAIAGLSFCAGNGSEEAKALATNTICRADEHTAKYVLELLKNFHS